MSQLLIHPHHQNNILCTVRCPSWFAVYDLYCLLSTSLGVRKDFFPLTHITLTLALFQKGWFSSGNWPASINIQSDSHHYASFTPSFLFHGVSGHHLRVCNFQASLFPHIPITLRPTAPVTIFQKGIFPHQITHLTFILSKQHSLISLPLSILVWRSSWQTSSSFHPCHPSSLSGLLSSDPYYVTPSPSIYPVYFPAYLPFLLLN